MGPQQKLNKISHILNFNLTNPDQILKQITTTFRIDKSFVLALFDDVHSVENIIELLEDFYQSCCYHNIAEY